MTELETMQRAKMYLDKLAQGIEPISGQEIPNDSVLNNVRLARCFFYVSGILDQVIANGGRVISERRISISPKRRFPVCSLHRKHFELPSLQIESRTGSMIRLGSG